MAAGKEEEAAADEGISPILWDYYKLEGNFVICRSCSYKTYFLSRTPQINMKWHLRRKHPDFNGEFLGKIKAVKKEKRKREEQEKKIKQAQRMSQKNKEEIAGPAEYISEEEGSVFSYFNCVLKKQKHVGGRALFFRCDQCEWKSFYTRKPDKKQISRKLAKHLLEAHHDTAARIQMIRHKRHCTNNGQCRVCSQSLVSSSDEEEEERKKAEEQVEMETVEEPVGEYPFGVPQLSKGFFKRYFSLPWPATSKSMEQKREQDQSVWEADAKPILQVCAEYDSQTKLIGLFDGQEWCSALCYTVSLAKTLAAKSVVRLVDFHKSRVTFQRERRDNNIRTLRQQALVIKRFEPLWAPLSGDGTPLAPHQNGGTSQQQDHDYFGGAWPLAPHDEEMCKLVKQAIEKLSAAREGDGPGAAARAVSLYEVVGFLLVHSDHPKWHKSTPKEALQSVLSALQATVRHGQILQVEGAQQAGGGEGVVPGSERANSSYLLLRPQPQPAAPAVPKQRRQFTFLRPKQTRIYRTYVPGTGPPPRDWTISTMAMDAPSTSSSRPVLARVGPLGRGNGGQLGPSTSTCSSGPALLGVQVKEEEPKPGGGEAEGQRRGRREALIEKSIGQVLTLTTVRVRKAGAGARAGNGRTVSVEEVLKRRVEEGRMDTDEEEEAGRHCWI